MTEAYLPGMEPDPIVNKKHRLQAIQCKRYVCPRCHSNDGGGHTVCWNAVERSYKCWVCNHILTAQTDKAREALDA